MTVLREKIARQIAHAGPIGVAEYMALCLFDPEHGYYTTREPFGTDGDFTTAPEISQMFGELVAVWLYNAWTAAGRPERPVLAEIGPGRGTLMKDMVRTLARIEPSFSRDALFRLVEVSPRLRQVQRRTLAGGPHSFAWCDRVADLPGGPLFIVGNELFDAIPLRQFVKTGSGWRERIVALDDQGGLRFTAGAAGVDASLLPPDAAAAPNGAIVEIAPARDAVMEDIAARLAACGGGALFVDYGYTTSAVGDTLQALRRHDYDDVLAHPGEADLTAHVDFAALARIARRHGLAADTLRQGEFLLEMGLLERAGSLGANKDEASRERLRSEVERLAGEDGMGSLFKVLAVCPAGFSVHPFLAAD